MDGWIWALVSFEPLVRPHLIQIRVCLTPKEGRKLLSIECLLLDIVQMLLHLIPTIIL